ncbi:MAG: efflux RND transporter periplasmic adaptor subunit [Sphingomonas sp.]|nr:efflux RND transporter periplasmic adaptor subunit [Sphingomonas sp.]
MRRDIAAGIMAIAGTLAACAGSAPKQSPPDGPPPVRIATVGAEQHAGMITGVGTVALRREASLGFTSAGRIARLTVNEGDQVRPGQLLAALDTTTVSADLARAKAERVRAAAEFRRSSNLIAQGWITRPRLENAQASLEAADASVRAAEFQRTNATITAPGNGVVLARLAEPGQVVAAGTPVLVVGEAASGYVLRVPLSDRDVTKLTDGAPATVTLAAMGGTPIAGNVIEIAGRGDRATGTFVVEISLPADPRLRSGQVGQARITVAAQAVTRLKVPATAVFAARAGEAFVYVVDRARRRVSVRRITIADTSDDGIEVTGGLRRGELIATSRIDRLKDGMTITPIGPAR